MARKAKPSKQSLAPEGGWPTGRKAAPAVFENLAKPAPSLIGGIDNDVSSRSVVWRFSDADREGEWCIDSCADLTGLIDKLVSFETMKVGEILTGSHGKVYVVEKMPTAARKRLLEIERDDETEIVSLRLSGRGRLHGFLREHVFHVLWWDPRHEVWPSTKKHT